MYAYLTITSLAVMMLFTPPAWGSGDKWQMSPKPADTSVFQANLLPMVDGSPVNVRNLGPHADRPHAQGILATTTWLKGAFSTEAEVNANQGSQEGDGLSARMMRLGIVGSTRLVRYGMTYRTADQAFYQKSPQEQKEAWGEWKNGPIDFAFRYAQNAAASTMNPLNLYPQRTSPHTVEAAIGYRSGIWDARLTSGYGTESDVLNHGAESLVQTETMTASFRPVSALTITPTLGYRAERLEWSSARIDSPSASLTMNYKKSQRFGITAIGNYFGVRSSDKLVDLDTIGGKGIVSWELEPLRDWKPQLSLEGGYNLQVNRLMPSAQTENFSGLLRFVLATM